MAIKTLQEIGIYPFEYINTLLRPVFFQISVQLKAGSPSSEI